MNINTLVPVLIGSIQNVARQTGFIFNLVSLDAKADSAAVGQSIDYSELPDITAGTVTPGMTVTASTDSPVTKKTLLITEHKYGAFNLSAEDIRGMGDRGAEFQSAAIDAAVASVMNAGSSYLAGVLRNGAGLAHGTPGTDPFATTPNSLVDCWRTLSDDLSPDMDRYAALSTSHYGSASKLTQFQKLNEAPSGTVFAEGRLGMLANWRTGYDQASGILQTTVAAGGYLVNNGAGYAIGAKAITVDTGTGGFAAGDVVTIAGSFEKDTATLAQYVVESATATIVTLTRGLITAVADNAALVRIATHRSSILGHRAATIMAWRASAEMPAGDQATQRVIVRDPDTGLSLRAAYYPGRHMGQWEVSAVYGALVRRPSWVRRLIA